MTKPKNKTPKAIVELKDVSVSYNDTHAIEGASLKIEKGDFLGLLGPNGGGKSTLIKVILGLVGNCCGTVKIFDEIICKGENKRRLHPATKSSGLIGYVPQNVMSQWSSFPGTVHEVVSTSLASRSRMFKRLNKEDHQRIEDTLRLTGIYELRFRKVGELSGGEQQRTFIARALASSPRLLILDEPTTGIDSPSQEKLYSILEKLNRDWGISIILSSHDLTAISKLANKLACINRSLFYHGNPENFFADESYLSEVYGYPVGLVKHDEHQVVETN